MNTNDQNQFHEVLRQFNTGMLITEEPGSFAHARPMAIARIDDNCDVWFLTGKGSGKVGEIESSSPKLEGNVLITCQKDRDYYLSLSGVASVVSDKDTIKGLWKESFRVWFPDGPDDPTIAAIHVRAIKGEYWDNSGVNKIKYLFESAKAYVTGSTPHVSEGQQHGKVAL